MITRNQHLLTVLAEECCEVAQRVSKALRFGVSEIQPGQPFTNAERIAQEFQDVLAAIEMLEAGGVLERPSDTHAIERKKAKVEEFMWYAVNCGELEDPDGHIWEQRR